MDRDLVTRLTRRIAEHAGFKLPEWVIVARVGERVTALGLDSVAEYTELVTGATGLRELDHLVEALRVGETRFFRQRSQLDAIRKVIAPAIAKTSAERVKVWSAGCATGEEPYTLAMLLHRALPAHTAIEILASDISSEALAHAREATYEGAALASVPAVLRDASFERLDHQRFRVRPHLRELVRFERRNLADPGFPNGFHLICCRNVLIYFTPEARAQTVERLTKSLVAGGFLVVGYAETLRDIASLSSVRTPDAVVYQRADKPAEPPKASRKFVARAMAETPPPAVEVCEAVIELRGHYDGRERLEAELSPVSHGSYTKVVINLDGAEYLDDVAADALRRIRDGARKRGIEVLITAERPGPSRWLRRAGLDGGRP